MKQIDIFFEDIEPIQIHNSYLENKSKELISKELKNVGDISIVLCSDEYLLQINKQYLNHNYYTDIITFDYVEGDTISGDLFISVDRVKENATLYEDQFLRELYRVVFHGILHLIGYKDKTEEEKGEMRKKEEEYLSGLNLRGLEK